MRLIKMFGLAAIAVGAFMAFLGASSASATSLEEVVLCKALETPCVNGHFATGTVVHGVATDPVLLGPFNILCLESTILGITTSLLAHGEITALALVHCLREGTNHTCTWTAERLNYLIKVELTSAHNTYEALVTAGSSGLRPEVRVQCPEDGIDCKYGADTLLYEALDVSGETVLNVLQELSGLGFCFITAVWHAKYKTKCLSSPTVEVNCYLAMEAGSVL
jgi:hypothetical protein